MSSWRDRVLAGGHEGWECEQRYSSDTKTAIFNWKTGLNPLAVRKVTVGETLNRTSQQLVKLLERVMRD